MSVELHDSLDGQAALVTGASPAWVRTDLGGPEAPKAPSEGADTPVWLSRFAPGSPSGKFWEDRAVIDW